MQQCATPILPSKEESTANAQLVDILRNRAQTPAHVRHSAVEHDLLPASSVSGPYDTAQLSQLVGKTNLSRYCWRIQKVGKYATKTGCFSLPVGNIDHLSCLEKIEHPYESRVRQQYLDKILLANPFKQVYREGKHLVG